MTFEAIILAAIPLSLALASDLRIIEAFLNEFLSNIYQHFQTALNKGAGPVCRDCYISSRT